MANVCGEAQGLRPQEPPWKLVLVASAFFYSWRATLIRLCTGIIIGSPGRLPAAAKRSDVSDQVPDFVRRKALAKRGHEWTFPKNVSTGRDAIEQRVIGTSGHFGGIGMHGWLSGEKRHVPAVAETFRTMTGRAVTKIIHATSHTLRRSHRRHDSVVDQRKVF